MRPSSRILGGLAVAILIAAGLTAFAGDDVTLEGRFVWVRDDGQHDGDLRAVFTPTGDDRWDVAFHFAWEDGPHVYSGTATGSLHDGPLRGEVLNDNREHPSRFAFDGAFENGVFNGKHVYVGDGETNETGTLTLRARP